MSKQEMTPAGMSQPAEVMAWLLSRLDADTYDEVTDWQRDVADLDYDGTTRSGRTEPVALTAPDGVPGALELGAWLTDEAGKTRVVEVPASTLLRLADRLDRLREHGDVQAELRALATQPEQRAQESAEHRAAREAATEEMHFGHVLDAMRRGLAGVQRKPVRPEPGWSVGLLSLGDLRDRLSRAGSSDWDLSTAREGLEEALERAERGDLPPYAEGRNT